MSSLRPLPAELVAPHPDRLSPEDPLYEVILARHAAAVRDGLTSYIDPATGFQAMTALALWQRGCCDQGCRHCPWIERPVTLPAAGA